MFLGLLGLHEPLQIDVTLLLASSVVVVAVVVYASIRQFWDPAGLFEPLHIYTIDAYQPLPTLVAICDRPAPIGPACGNLASHVVRPVCQQVIVETVDQQVSWGVVDDHCP